MSETKTTSTPSRPTGAFALVAPQVFDGERLLADHAVVVVGGRIEALVPAATLPAGLERRAAEGLLAPGFIDTQVNGGGGVLFNDNPNIAGIAAIAAAHRAFGTTALLPTFITDARPRMAAAIAAVRAAVAAGVPGVLGIHLEGPFLNRERAGAHDPDRIATFAAADLALLTSLGVGRTLVTLAPETVDDATIAALTAAGVVVSAGHTTASVERIAAARRAGLTGFTHVYNAMPPLMARTPGPVGAALSDPDAWAGIIVDLHHVAPTAVRVAVAARGWRRTMLITDAMPTVGSEAHEFTLQGRRIVRDGGRLVTAEGVLAGSDLDMATAVRNAISVVGLPLAAALHMASRAPAEFLGLGHELGRIAPGYRASLVLLDAGLRAVATWIDGVGEG